MSTHPTHADATLTRRLVLHAVWCAHCGVLVPPAAARRNADGEWCCRDLTRCARQRRADATPTGAGEVAA